MNDLFVRLATSDIKKEEELSQIELDFHLKIPNEFKFFYSNFILRNIANEKGNKGIAYSSERISNYYTNKILLSHFCNNYEMKLWFEIYQPLDFFNNEGLQIAITYGSTFIVLIANEGSPNYGKVLYYDLEMSPDEVFVLGDNFNEFLNFISEVY